MSRCLPAVAGVSMLLALVAPVPLLAAADTLAAVNGARHGACRASTAARLAPSPALDAAAQAMAAGQPLAEALRTAGYRADEALSIRVAGAATPDRVTRALEQRFCNDLANPALTQGGFVRRGDELWIVLARPFEPPRAADQPRVAARVLALVNEARAAGRRCGRHAHPAAGPLTGDRRLDAVALAHSRDQAARGVLAHEGADGSGAGRRVERAGYAAARVGENVAAGPTTPEDVVQGWLDSPEHCANLMDARYTRMGIGYAVARDGPGGIYWTQVLATPQ